MAQTIREKAKIRQNREEDRPSEDDIAREHLGPRGQKGVPDTATMTEDSKLQTPSPLDPGTRPDTAPPALPVLSLQPLSSVKKNPAEAGLEC